MRLATFDGAVHIGGFDEKFRLVVGIFELGASEEISPVSLVDFLAQIVVHVFALGGEFSQGVFFQGVDR